MDGKPSDKVYLLRLDEGFKAVLDTLPSLPVPAAEAGWSVYDGHLLIAASGSVCCCAVGDYEWRELAAMPEPLVQPVLYACDKGIFLWGGFNPQTLEVCPQGWMLSRDDPDAGWQPAPGVPDCGTFVGATAAVLPDGRLVVAGGVNRDIFARALHNTPEDRIPYLSKEPAEYRFRSSVYVFDGACWSEALQDGAFALAGPGVAAAADGTLLIAGGEVKPGVRSPKIFSIKL